MYCHSVIHREERTVLTHLVRCGKMLLPIISNIIKMIKLNFGAEKLR